MAIQLFVRAKDSTCRKAERFFAERGLKVHRVDLDAKPASKGEIESMARALGGVDLLVDREGKAWLEGGYAHRIVEMPDELVKNPGLLKVPLVRWSKGVSAGDDEKAWKCCAADEKA